MFSISQLYKYTQCLCYKYIILYEYWIWFSVNFGILHYIYINIIIIYKINKQSMH